MLKLAMVEEGCEMEQVNGEGGGSRASGHVGRPPQLFLGVIQAFHTKRMSNERCSINVC